MIPFMQGLTPSGHSDSGLSTVVYGQTGIPKVGIYTGMVFIQGWASYRLISSFIGIQIRNIVVGNRPRMNII